MAANVAECIQRRTGETVNSVSMFYTAGVDGEVYQSRSYTRITTRNSYTVCYTQGEEERYGLVEYCILFKRKTLAVVTPLLQHATPSYPEVLSILNSRIVPVKIGPSVDVVCINKFVSKVVLVSFSSSHMSVESPTHFVTDYVHIITFLFST